MKIRLAILLLCCLMTACIRQVPPEPSGLDRLVMTYQAPEQRQEIQAFFDKEGISLKTMNAAGNKVEFMLTVPEDKVEDLLEHLSRFSARYRVQRKEHSLYLLCCQP